MKIKQLSQLIMGFIFIVVVAILKSTPENFALARRIDREEVSQTAFIYLPFVANECLIDDDIGPITCGNIHTLSILVNLTDSQVGCTEPQITTSMFADTNSVNAAYSESSRGLLTINGDVVSVDVDYSSSDGCVREEWAAAADAAAKAKGFNLNDYDRFVYIMPFDLLNDVCPWGGNTSPDRKQVWTLRCEQPQVVAHELGHTFGLYHASTEIEEYGDFSDPMGGKIGMPLTQFNAPHRSQMGWLPESSLKDVLQSGTYMLEATEIDPDEATYPQILRIKKLDTDEYYYVSLRNGIDLDANLEPSYRDNFVSVHRYRGFGFAPGYPPPNTYLDALLGDNQSFIDEINGITITLVSHQAGIAVIRIDIE